MLVAGERLPVLSSVARRGLLLAVASVVALPAGSASAVEVATPWKYAGIGPSQTLIRILANGGRCEAPGTPLVEETETSVRITAITVQPPLDSPCPAVIDFDSVYVPLSKPLAGRKLLGAAQPPIATAFIASIPRVVGLSPGDAITAFSIARVPPSGTPAKPVIVRRKGGTGLRRIVSQKGLRIVISGGSDAR